MRTFCSWSEAQSSWAKAPRAVLAVTVFDFLQAHFCGNCKPGTDCFTTVNAVINSAITKLAQVTPLAPDRTLYRGVSLMGLPEELLEIEHGPRGFVEFAFSSATPNREVALEYAGICDCEVKTQEARAAAEAAGGLDTVQGLYAVQQHNCSVTLILPALTAAADALGDVTPQQIDALRFVCKAVFTLEIENSLDEHIKGVMQAVCVTQGAANPGWVDVQALLEDPSFPMSLKDYNAHTMSDSTLAQLTRLIDESISTSESIASVSVPAALLWDWCIAVQALANLSRKIQDAGGINSQDGLQIAVAGGGAVQVYSPWHHKEGYCDLHRSTILEIRTGQMNRGATLKFISQFPDENEHVLLPLSHFEVTGMRREKHLNIIETNLSVNPNSTTMEQLRESRKNAVLNLGTVLLGESVPLLSCSPSQIEARLLGELRHAGADSFSDIVLFRSRINELLHDWQTIMDTEALHLSSRAQEWYSQGAPQGDRVHPDDIAQAAKSAIHILQLTAASSTTKHPLIDLINLHQSVSATSSQDPTSLQTLALENAAKEPYISGKRDTEWSQRDPEWRGRSDQVAAMVAKLGDAFASALDGYGTQFKALQHYESAIKLLSAECGPSQTSDLIDLCQKKALVLVLKGEAEYSSNAETQAFMQALKSFEQGLHLAQASVDAGGESDNYSLLISAEIMENIGVLLYKHRRHLDTDAKMERLGSILTFRRALGAPSLGKHDAVRMLEESVIR